MALALLLRCECMQTSALLNMCVDNINIEKYYIHKVVGIVLHVSLCVMLKRSCIITIPWWHYS